MGQFFVGGVSFLAAIAGLLIILLIVYFCIKREMCCCQRVPDNGDDEGEEGEDPLLEKFYEDNDDYKPPYRPIREQVDGGELRYVNSDQCDTSDMSGDDLLSALPKTHMSVRTRADSIETDSLFDHGDRRGKKIKDTHIDGCSLKISLLYSKSDLFLMLTVLEVAGMPDKTSGGYNYIRVSVTLLPEKKYRSKTRLQHVKDDVVGFSESFKFSNVTRESLFTSAFRFRLYARNKVAKEVCVGELFVQLADVAQRKGGFVTSKPFERRKLR